MMCSTDLEMPLRDPSDSSVVLATNPAVSIECKTATLENQPLAMSMYRFKLLLPFIEFLLG